MVDGIRPAQDIGGLGRLADAIRLNRQEKRQAALDEQNAITRGLQQQGLRLGIQQQEAGLSDLMRQQKQRADISAAIQAAPDKDPDLVTLQTLQRSDPVAAQKFQDGIFDQVGAIAKLNPKAAVDVLNAKTGNDFEFQGKKGKLIQVGSPSSGKVVLYDPDTREVVETLEFEQRLTPQQEAFSKLTPEQQAATFFKSGQTVEMTPEGGFKITSGGTSLPQKKFEAKQKEKATKSVERERQSLQKTDIVLTKVDEALKQVGLSTAGAGSVLAGLPGTAARDLRSTIDTIKANLAFNALQAMREASPTGGALGAVSERELNLLESTIASLDTGQSPERLRANLEQIKTLFNNAKARIEQAQKLRESGVDPNQVSDELNTLLDAGGRPEPGGVTVFDFNAQGQQLKGDKRIGQRISADPTERPSAEQAVLRPSETTEIGPRGFLRPSPSAVQQPVLRPGPGVIVGPQGFLIPDPKQFQPL